MPNINRIDAFNILGLQQNHKYEKKDIDQAYRQKARKCHPDKRGGSHEDFLALSEAYQIILNCFETSNVEGPVENKKQSTKANVNPSVDEALAKLYTKMSTVRKKLDTYGTSKTICLNQLNEIFDNIRRSLLNIIETEENINSASLRIQAERLTSNIDNIYRGPTPASAAVFSGAFLTISLGILALLIALSPPAGIVLGTAVLSGLIATPPVGGLLFGTFCFFTARTADKNRSEQQKEMREIVEAIKELANSIDLDIQCKDLSTVRDGVSFSNR